MRCPSCGHENREGRKFCVQCGAGLVLVCPSCGAGTEPRERFCGECGATLGEIASAPHTPEAAAALPASFASGRYQVQRFLGEGGKKRVYLARDRSLDRDVALAVIKTEGLDAEGLTRVRREAQAMGRLGDNPHVVTVLDMPDEAGQPYIVMEYMEGGSLEDVLQQAANHRLAIDQGLRLAGQVCQALEHAHERGIIHRDLKPGNIWLTQDGTAKLGDFGLAVALDRSRLTQAGMMLGTVAYMPPEFAVGGGRAADARSDLYSLGAMLYEMVAGRPPFAGDDAVSIISQHINTRPVAPSWHNEEVPRALEALILRLLAKAPEERPESAAAVREALSAIASSATAGAERATQKDANPLDRLAGGVFVGREKEMDELRAGLEDALSGRGRLMMLVGEPGIGKTRTADEFATYARLRNAQVLWGRCYEGEGAPAYWPWVQLIRSYVYERQPEVLMSEMGPGAADIAQVVSEVRERLPGLPEPPALEPEQARFRLFDSITTFLKNAAKRQPIVLVLDDLHWADKPSLLLLQFLASELHGARVAVVGTYRDVELGRQHPLSQTLGELAREELSQRILLRGLSERDVSRFIEMTAGREPPELLVTAVYKETEGNPFFVNEIVRLLVAEGRLEQPEEVKSWSITIPQGVREVVGRRLDHLSGECNRVLTVASVVGREFELEVIERVSEFSGDRLLELLEEAVAARVVTEATRVGGYGFSHLLIRETLYKELSTARRVRLHRQIGEVLEGLYGAKPERYLGELAYHFFEGVQAGADVDKAIAYARRAGERATAQLAYEEAAGHYERALQAMELKEPFDERQRCELLLALADAQWREGETPRARETFQRAADIAKKVDAADLLAQAALGFAGPPESGRGGDKLLIALLEDALRSLGEDDSALRARAQARLAVSRFLTGAPEQAAPLSRQAAEMARRIGEPAVLAYVLRARHMVLVGPEHVEDRLAVAADILQLAERAGDKEMAMFGHGWRLTDLLELGDISAVDQEAEAGTPLVEELRHPLYLNQRARIRAMLALLQGRFEEAELQAQQALLFGQRAQAQDAVDIFAVQIALVRREQGRSGELEEALKSYVEQQPEVAAWRSGLALLYSEIGREEEARAEFERLAANDFADLPEDLLRLIVVILLSEVCSFLGDARRAQVLYEFLLPYAQRCIVIPIAVACYGSGSRYLGLLAATMSRDEEAARHFEDALAMNGRMRARPLVAHTQYDYAQLLLRGDRPGHRVKALKLLTQALDTAQELGMKRLVEQALARKMELQGIAYGDIKTSIDAVAHSVQTEQPDLRPHAAPDGTVTLFFTDIEDSTPMNERMGDQRWMDLLRAHNALVRQEIRSHDGYEVKTEGDGFMVAFGSARKALLCAIAVQRSFAKHNESAEEPLRIRIGLHTGEAVQEAGDFYGKHVNLASRIADQAKGGEIVVSSLLRELTESAGDIAFGDGREVVLKGLSGTQLVFSVGWDTRLGK